ncbi:MAG: hypothetical protein Q8P26_02710 [Candidatus Levybacteria bacterium]|nr:hypothetical protein [Candidatus Levybacteria bacterium]MDZ4227912.1 hypothetical protein [Candidatus Levybacteria bacterium]
MVELDRGVRSSITNQESEGFIPSLTMRPHHFFKPFVRDALRRKRNSKEIKLVNGRVNCKTFIPENISFFPVDQRNYFRDLVGKTKADKNRFQSAIEDYLTALWKLPNQSFIHLDLQADGICKATYGGKHCAAIYVRGEKIDPFNGERHQLSNIVFKLKDAGYKLGEDFIHRETSSILYDYDHRSLSTRKPVVPKIFIFDSLIVRTGALRKI